MGVNLQRDRDGTNIYSKGEAEKLENRDAAPRRGWTPQAGCFKLVPIPAVTIGTHGGPFSRNLILSEPVRAAISYNLI